MGSNKKKATRSHNVCTKITSALSNNRSGNKTNNIVKVYLMRKWSYGQHTTLFSGYSGGVTCWSLLI